MAASSDLDRLSVHDRYLCELPPAASYEHQVVVQQVIPRVLREALQALDQRLQAFDTRLSSHRTANTNAQMQRLLQELRETQKLMYQQIEGLVTQQERWRLHVGGQILSALETDYQVAVEATDWNAAPTAAAASHVPSSPVVAATTTPTVESFGGGGGGGGKKTRGRPRAQSVPAPPPAIDEEDLF
jgi:hypothetical protein